MGEDSGAGVGWSDWGGGAGWPETEIDIFPSCFEFSFVWLWPAAGFIAIPSGLQMVAQWGCQRGFIGTVRGKGMANHSGTEIPPIPRVFSGLVNL